jgi:AbiV family abortive infection protein
MKDPVLHPYWGKLPPEKIAEGMNIARRNATRLASDARTMFRTQHYETATALAILAIEESGKVSILRELALVADDREAKHIWRRLRSHTAKNAMWIFPELVARGARRLDEFAAVFDSSSDHAETLDKVKQVSIYSDCYGKARWHEPTGTIAEDFAGHLVKMAEVFARGPEITTREIELWIEHMGPVRLRSHTWQRKALANWWAQLEAEGLAPEGQPSMEEFIWGSGPPSGG